MLSIRLLGIKAAELAIDTISENPIFNKTLTLTLIESKIDDELKELGKGKETEKENGK